MPQMSPMSWILLLVSFTIMIISVISMMYFTYLPKRTAKRSKNIKVLLKELNSNTRYWKW
uniref:ATP synthase F0 subunit 8 n=1 Tax=Janus megamaculatus TaxID=2876199 RepID=A0A8K1WHM2_9HYME|nr:ATP synthase F0 subunit 8 [Janus megamaculatus]